ncbi:hypothetical protein VZT92_023844 [Zoarces viviparus]|uniref:Uncharacterized protein n=1 Tax=Zoarces viviparus TaxID=48416 RepID=A0AAW1E8P1_ZOAVI
MIKTPGGVASDSGELNVPLSEIKRPFDSEEPRLPPPVCFQGEGFRSLFILLRLAETPVEVSPRSQPSGTALNWKVSLKVETSKAPRHPPHFGSSCRAFVPLGVSRPAHLNTMAAFTRKFL